MQEAKDDWIAKNDRTSRKRRMYSEHDDSEDEEAVPESNDGEIVAPKPLVRLRVRQLSICDPVHARHPLSRFDDQSLDLFRSSTVEASRFSTLSASEVSS